MDLLVAFFHFHANELTKKHSKGAIKQRRVSDHNRTGFTLSPYHRHISGLPTAFFITSPALSLRGSFFLNNGGDGHVTEVGFQFLFHCVFGVLQPSVATAGGGRVFGTSNSVRVAIRRVARITNIWPTHHNGLILQGLITGMATRRAKAKSTGVTCRAFHSQRAYFVTSFGAVFQRHFTTISRDQCNTYLYAQHSNFALVFRSITVRFIGRGPKNFVERTSDRHVFYRSMTQRRDFVIGIGLARAFDRLVRLFYKSKFYAGADSTPTKGVRFDRVFFVRTTLTRFVTGQQHGKGNTTVFASRFGPLREARNGVLDTRVVC